MLSSLKTSLVSSFSVVSALDLLQDLGSVPRLKGQNIGDLDLATLGLAWYSAAVRGCRRRKAFGRNLGLHHLRHSRALQRTSFASLSDHVDGKRSLHSVYLVLERKSIGWS